MTLREREVGFLYLLSPVISRYNFPSRDLLVSELMIDLSDPYLGIVALYSVAGPNPSMVCLV